MSSHREGGGTCWPIVAQRSPLIPGKHTARQGDPEPGSSLTHTHTCTANKQASFFSCLFLFSSHFNHTFSLPSTGSIYPPSLSFSLLIPLLLSPLSVLLTPPLTKKTPATSHTHHTPTHPPPTPGDDFSTASALPIQPRRVPIYS